MKEFVQNGFDKGSTNEIIKRANISKGSLFNYFNSKKDLYVYLIEHCVQVIEWFFGQIDVSQTDLFKRIEDIGLQKMHIHHTYPQVFDCLSASIQDESSEVQAIIKQKVVRIYDDGTKIVYDNIEYYLFRDDIDIEKAIEILT